MTVISGKRFSSTVCKVILLINFSYDRQHNSLYKMKHSLSKMDLVVYIYIINVKCYFIFFNYKNVITIFIFYKLFLD
jgi:hypothetical protein